jgi:hypothetical protein
MLALQRIYKPACRQRRNRTVGGSRGNLANLLGTAIACDEDAAVRLGGAILTCDNVAANVKVNRTSERLVGGLLSDADEHTVNRQSTSLAVLGIADLDAAQSLVAEELIHNA